MHLTRRQQIQVMLGSAAASALPTVARGAEGLPQGARPFFNGINFGYLARQGYYGSPAGLAEADRIADAGIRWVSLIVMIMQDAFYSTHVYKDFEFTQSDDELRTMIARLRKRGVKIILKPMIDCRDSSWRGRISFPKDDQQIQGVTTDYWTPWFKSMTRAIVFYARMADELGVEAFTVAQELYGTDTQTDKWLETVDAVRRVYKGILTVNADGRANLSDPAIVRWMRTCDAVGVSFYPNLDVPDRPTRQDVVAALAPSVTRIREAHRLMQRPIFFAEFGARSVAGGLKVTGEYRNVGAYDGDLQALYLDTLLDTFWKEPGWAGYQYWKWDEQQARPQYKQAGGDAGFQVQGKPAEAVLKRWSARQR